MGPLDVVHLTALMDRTSGRLQIIVGRIEGVVLPITSRSCQAEHPRGSTSLRCDWTDFVHTFALPARHLRRCLSARTPSPSTSSASQAKKGRR